MSCRFRWYFVSP